MPNRIRYHHTKFENHMTILKCQNLRTKNDKIAMFKMDTLTFQLIIELLCSSQGPNYLRRTDGRTDRLTLIVEKLLVFRLCKTMDMRIHLSVAGFTPTKCNLMICKNLYFYDDGTKCKRNCFKIGIINIKNGNIHKSS